MLLEPEVISSFFMLPRVHVLMNSWVLDCCLMLPKSESLSHYEALRSYQPVISRRVGFLCGTHAFDIRTQGLSVATLRM